MMNSIVAFIYDDDYTSSVLSNLLTVIEYL